MRADRLLSLMLLLHARGRMTAQDLAEQLEVSERTVYRDIEALSVAGVPVYTQPGTNGGVFLDENYRISLTGLSKAEVMSLFVSSDTGPLSDLGLARAVEDTLLKLFAALPSIHRQEVERMRQRLHIDPADWFQLVEPLPCLSILQQAVWEDRKVDITYQPVEGAQIKRTIEAYALVAKGNIWYLVGKESGGEMRTYRVARFQEVTLTDAVFERSPDFDLAAYWKDSSRAFEEKMLETFPPYPATVRVHPDLLWWFESYMTGKYEQVGSPDGEGWVTLRVVYEAWGDALMRVLGLGPSIEVLEPDELRADVVKTARAVVDFYASR